MRQRLLVTLLISVIAVPAAGGPGLDGAVGDLSESQRLLRLTQLDTAAVALSHSLADERDDMTAFVAAGHSTASGHGVSEDERARVDRQAAEVTQQAAALDTGGSADLVRVTGDLRTALASLSHIRQSALSGLSTAKDAFDAYTPLIDTLDGVSAALARALPARAADADTDAGPALARAVALADAERGLLVAALTAGGPSSALVGEAQQARVGEQAALAGFDATATQPARTQYAQTVTGTDVATAESYLRRLTGKGSLSPADDRLRTSDVAAALAARIDRMRAVQASLAQAGSNRLTALRDDDVTTLELHIALVGACALLVLGVGIQNARSLTRPLAALRRYTDAQVTGDTEVPVPVASRDEFAAIARSVERLAKDTVRLREETAEQEKERKRLVANREKVAAERDGLRRRLATQRAELQQEFSAEKDELRAAFAAEKDGLRGELAAESAQLRQRHETLLKEKEALTARLVSLQGAVHGTFVNLSLRTLALVERQLALIEGLEDREQDPEQLETLFKLDHLATRMRRNSESLLVLAGSETGGGTPARPVSLLDVVRAGVSEIERYERVRIPFLPRAQLAGFAADDTSHVVAELLENATAFSPPDAEVQVSGWLLENGEIMVSIEDSGIGVPEAKLAELNATLADPHPDESTAAAGLGLYVVARLAGRHGIRVQLREQKQGGLAAVVVIPRALLVQPDDQGGLPGGAEQDSADATGAVRPGRRRAVPPPRRSVDPGVPAAVPEQPPAAPPADAPDEHARPQAADGPAPDDPPARPRAARPAAPAAEESVTGKGLPKRVPRTSGLYGEPAARGGSGPVDADSLRRRLGGFAQGLREGRRHAEAEATGTLEMPLPAPEQHPEATTSEPSEEARG